METKRAQKKVMQGLVTSDKMEKTVVVSITTQVKHPQIGKYIKRTKKFFAHDEKSECGVGDTIEIEESRALSKNKNWKFKKMIRKAK